MTNSNPINSNSNPINSIKISIEITSFANEDFVEFILTDNNELYSRIKENSYCPNRIRLFTVGGGFDSDIVEIFFKENLATIIEIIEANSDEEVDYLCNKLSSLYFSDVSEGRFEIE